jgi:hypothetical protein
MKFTEPVSWRRVALGAAGLVLVITATSWPYAAPGPIAPDVGGVWDWHERSVVLAPTEFIVAFFGPLEPEGPVMRLSCDAWGTMTLQQNGSSFSGSTGQDGTCTTQGGQVTPVTPFPPSFTVSGSIDGHAVKFDADVGQGIVCSYQGSLSVSNGVATRFDTSGGCDVPFPFHPNMNKSLSFDMTRVD